MVFFQCYQDLLPLFIYIYYIRGAILQQTFDTVPQNLETNTGSLILMLCQVHNRNGECVWLKDGVVLGLIPNKYIFDRAPPDGNCSLTIKNADLRDDDALWQCQVTPAAYGDETLASPEIKLTVRELPLHPFITADNLIETGRGDVSMYAQDGDRKKLTCVTRKGNPPTVFKWFLNETEITSNITNTTGSDPMKPKTWESTSVLYFTFRKRFNNEILKCVAFHNSYETKSEETDIRLDVLYPPDQFPKIQMEGGNRTIVEGMTVVLNCSADANPRANFTWKREFFIGYYSKTNKLKFEPIKRSNSGMFVCLAKNDIGTSNKARIMLDVKYPPDSVPKISLEGELGFEGRVVEGKKILMTCSVNANPPAEFIWKKSGYPGILDTEDKIYFNPISRNDSGVFNCSGKNDYGQTETATVTLDVKYAPDKIPAIQLDIEPRANGTLLEGMMVSLNCSADADPPAKIFWRKSGTDGILSMVNQIEFYPINRSDSGVFSCVAENNVGQSNRAEITLDVKYPPDSIPEIRLEKQLEGVEGVVEGRTVVLKCLIDANPPAEFTWRKFGYPGVYATTDRIEFKPIWRNDSGVYNCSARNKFGRSEAVEFTLDVKYVPAQIPTIRMEVESKENGTIVEGMAVFLNCSVDANPPAKIIWRKFGDEGKRAMVDQLAFNPITRNESGVFSCVGENDYGQSESATITLDVKYPPDSVPKIRLKDEGGVIEGKTVVMKCLVDANPPAEFIWRKSGYPGIYAVTDQIEFNPISRNDSGVFNCSAENDFGKSNSSEEITLDVKYLPDKFPNIRLEVEPKVGETILEGMTVYLNCSANANPPAKIIWRKSGIDGIYTMMAQLEFNPINRNDSGVFSCQAENEIGQSQSVEIKLDVKYAPDSIPKIRLEGELNSKLGVVEGKRIVLKCLADANPPAEFFWKKSGYTGIYDTKNPIEFYPVDRNDSGVFTCSAKNEFGQSKTTEISLNVKYLPDRFPEIRLETEPISNGTIVEGMTVVLKCFSKANPPAKIIWIKFAHPGLYDNMEQIEFKPIRRNDSGDFLCRGKNEVGRSDTSEILLDVKYPPASFPEIRMQLGPFDNEDIIEGTSIALKCLADANPPANFTWRKVGYDGIIATKDILILIPISRNDNGTYSCSAWNAYGQTGETKINLDVKYDPSTPNISVERGPGDDETIVEGVNVVLKCVTDANPRAQIMWEKSGFPGIYDITDQIAFNSITRKDSGVYSCSAKNNIGESQKVEIILDVKYRPDIQLIMQPEGYKTMVENKTRIALECLADANPPATVFWRKSGYNAIYSTTNRIDFNPVRRNDSGVFSCLAENGVGESKKLDITLNVMYPPNSLPEIQLEAGSEGNATIIEGITVVLKCLVDANPSAKIFWRKAGHAGIYKTAIQILFNPINRIDSGIYSCMGKNDLGQSDDMNIALEVKYPPKIQIERGTRGKEDVLEGRVMVLKCLVDANPKANIFWKKADYPGIYGAFDQILFDPIGRKDSGIFICSAKNGIGKTIEQKITLDVKYKPKILRIFPPSGTKINIHQTVKLTCEAEGNPIPRYSWLQRTGKLVKWKEKTTNATFITSDVSYAFQGTYICRATNMISGFLNSVESEEIFLEVQTRPEAYPDSITAKSRRFHVDNGKTAVLKVFFCADPPPTVISWKLDNYTTLNVNKTFSRYTAENLQPVSDRSHCYEARLIVKDVQKCDSKTYSLFIENEAGKEKFDVSLQTREPLNIWLHLGIGVLIILLLLLLLILFIWCLAKKKKCCFNDSDANNLEPEVTAENSSEPNMEESTNITTEVEEITEKEN